MSGSPVRLIKLNRYLTYQFYGEMFHHALSPREGLKYGALACLSWLRGRLDGYEIPGELQMPEKEDYSRVKDEDLKSFHLRDDHMIDVVCDLEEGIWALRVIENDLGALNKDPVPGRSIQSDIAFRVTDGRLECGFRTSVSDKENVEKAGCIRFSLVRELCEDPLFGLRQVDRIGDEDHMEINDEDGLDAMHQVYMSRENQLPFLIYTYDDFSGRSVSGIGRDKSGIYELQKQSIQQNVLSRKLPYGSRYMGYGRPYFLPKRMFDRFDSLFGSQRHDAGDVILIEPRKYGGGVRVFTYEDKDRYQDLVLNHSRDRVVDFRDVLFCEEAQILAERKQEGYVSSILEKLDETSRNLESVRNQVLRAERISSYQKEDDGKNRQLEEALKNLQKSENVNLVLNNEIEKLKREAARKDEYVSYLERKVSRPFKHSEIKDWVKDYRYVVLDKKAVDCLERKDAENVDIGVICDSLDYLEHLYAKYLFEGMEKDELNDRSSRIYNRPFEVSPSGIPVSARGECKIKYEFSDGVRREYPLDWHLKAGNHGELIRIYFLIDKDRKKMIVGSLPNHLVY